MSKPRVVHFLGELLGVGEDLIHKLVCNNIKCSIVDNWYDLLISKMSTELEVFSERPILFNPDLVDSNDMLLYFALHGQTVDFDIPSDKKHWWVSQQDVAACLLRLIDYTRPLPQFIHICGRRGWTNQETFEQLELLYNRTIAGSSGQFQTSHLESKPVIHPTVAKGSQITPSTRPDLSIINELLIDIDGEGWRPLIPLRTTLMHYLATKDLDYRV